MQPSILCKVKIIITTCNDEDYNNFENSTSKKDNNKKFRIKIDEHSPNTCLNVRFK